jgi:hypothetical protein
MLVAIGVAVFALGMTEIASAQTCVPPPPGMVSWWPGDGDANDITGGNHGTLQNGATFATGLVGQAFSFVGLDDIVRVPHNSNLNVGTGDVTIDAWMKLSNLTFTDDRVIMGKYSTNPSDTPFPGYIFRWLGGKLQFIIDSELGGFTPSVQDKKVEATITRDTNWHHVAAVRRGLTMELFYDGVLVATATHSSLEYADNTADVGIGNGVGALDNGFPGLIDELEFFNRALSAAEVAALFNAGSAGKCKVNVVIDINPGSFPNSVNPRNNGGIPVAILTTATFDASTVNPMSVRFGPNGAGEAHGQGHLEDVDGDGELDLVLHFRTQAAGIVCGATSASLTGQTFGGQSISGTDSVRTVGCR